jgi:hypothetical protein
MELKDRGFDVRVEVEKSITTKSGKDIGWRCGRGR